MSNFQLLTDEVVLYEGTVSSRTYRGNLKITLTSRNIIIEKEVGIIKKSLELVDSFPINTIKCYNGSPQITQKGTSIQIQTQSENIDLTFTGIIDASKFTNKLIDVLTGTTLAKRGSQKVKDAFALVDDTLGLDTRGTLKGLLENGVKGILLNGIGKKK